jgi:uroporphyrinogen-III synthase
VSTNPTLNGLAVLVTRPAAQAEGLCQLIESAGGVALRLPLQAIAPVAEPAIAAAQLEACHDWNWWLFSSTNAVQEAAQLLPLPWPRVAAVGAVTAAALRALGITEVLAPNSGDGARALLAHPVFSEVRGQRFALIAGENPLPELAETLAARGAIVASIAVYRRLLVPYPIAEVARMLTQAQIAIVPSGEALMQLFTLVPAHLRSLLLRLQLAVPSPRVVEKALQLGFGRTPLLPQRVTDAAYLEVLQLYCNAGEQDRL